MPWWNYGCNSKLSSKHIVINELMIMIAIVFMMEVIIMNNKWMTKTMTLRKTFVVIKAIIKPIIDNNNNDNDSDNNNL